MFRSTIIAVASLLAVSALEVSPANAKIKIIIDDGRIFCGQGEDILWRRGYNRIVPLDCSGKYYEYRARRNGYRYNIRMKSSNGAIVEIDRY